MIKKLFLALVFFLAYQLSLSAQTVIAFQGGEGTPSDNWGFVPIASAGGPPSLLPGPQTSVVRTGLKSIRAGGGNYSMNCTGGASAFLGCSSPIFFGTGTINGTILTITATTNGLLSVNSPVNGTGIVPGTYISAFNQFTGYISGNTLTVTAVSSGSLSLNAPLFGTGIAAGTFITAFVSGTGGVGTYTINTNQSIASTSINTGTGGIGTYTVSTSQTAPSTNINNYSATGCNMHGKTLEFAPVCVSGLSSLQLKAYHSSNPGQFNCGGGFDTPDFIYFEVNENNTGWVTIYTLGGGFDNTWSYSTSGGNLPNVVPNPILYNVTPGTSTFAFRVRGVMDRADEFFYIDDVSLTAGGTVTTGTAGLWTGSTNTDWHNPCNWHNKNLPISTTSVSIPDTSINYCEVMPGNTAVCGALNVNDTLKVEHPTSSLIVNGNFTLQANGLLDMSTSATIGGNMALTSNWINQRNESFFHEQGSKVLFNGTGNQNIQVTGLNSNKEVFSVLEINKAGGRVIANQNIEVDPNNERGNIVVLALNNGLLEFKNLKKELLVGNFFANSVNRTNGGICLEDPTYLTKFTRAVDPSQGTYFFPICAFTVSALNPYQFVPVTLSNLSGGAGYVTINSYNTPANNLPLPTVPISVNNLFGPNGLVDNSAATVNRFWHLSSTPLMTGSIKFTYNYVTEIPSVPYNNASQINAQRYIDSLEKWEPYLPGQTAGAYFVLVPNTSISNTWALSSSISPLPVELLYFNAIVNANQKVNLFWETASETNSWRFAVERSDGLNPFEKILEVNAAGNSTSNLDYTALDQYPLQGVSYYRLREIDIDGSEQLSEPVKVVIDDKSRSNFSLYPNPTNHEFFLVSHGTNTTYKLLDAMGRVLKTIIPQSGHTTRVDCQDLPNGIYFVLDDAGFAQKLIVQ